MKRITSSVVSVAIALAGCATSSKDVTTSYVSPVQFQSYDCDQIQSEALRIQARVSQLGGRLDEAATHDQQIAGVGLILFWPALFALGGTKQQEAEYARLKGEYDAIQQSAVAKKCSGVVVATVQADKSLTTTPSKSDGTGVIAPAKTNEEKLTELKRLFDAGLISPEVYSAQQKAILGG